MNPNVNIQISNIAIQLKNLAMQLENISQAQNMVIPNLSNQLENMGIQTLNIGMQIINTGIITSNSGNGNPNLGQQLKDLGNQIQNFGLNIDNNNQIQMNMQMQMNQMMMNQMMMNQMMNFNPNPEILTLKFHYNYLDKEIEINISHKKLVQDAIDLFKIQANIDDMSNTKFIFEAHALNPELEIGKTGLKNNSEIFVIKQQPIG